MNSEVLTLLDQQELLQMALKASIEGSAPLTLACLKEAVRRSDASAYAHYLLGAEYAQLAMFARAIGAMEDALALEPTLWTARLQLALLYIDAGRKDEARQVLEPLATREGSGSLRFYAVGLLQLCQDELQAARDALQEGLGQDDPQAPLARDMRRLSDELLRQLEEAGGAGNELLLSAYAGNQRY